jgi:outer membrane protein OmpA-like peptidoglycan-associated protein
MLAPSMKNHAGALSIFAVLGFLSTDALAQGRVTFGGGAGASTGGGAAPPPAPPAAPAAEPGSSGATAATPPPVEEKKGDEWTARDRAIMESNTLVGGSGLLNTQHMQTGAPGQFRLSFTMNGFGDGFLCNAEQSCRDPVTGQLTTNNTTAQFAGTINLGVTIFKFLEAYASTGASATSNALNRPSLLQVLGDSAIGVKGVSADLLKVFHFGGFAELRLVNGSGFVGLSGGGTSGRFGLGGTVDFRELKSEIPLRVSTNVAYFVDNSAATIADTETARGQPITRIERFGLKINRVDHFDWHLGVEGMFLEERIRPFLEYSLYGPVNRQGYACRLNNPSGDFCLANQTTPPSKLTLGARFFPWKKSFSLLLGVDIGVTGTSKFIEEVSPMAPYSVYFGAGWATDTHDRPPVEKITTVEKVVEGKPPKRAKIVGFVHEKDKQEGIGGAIVSWEGRDYTAYATGPDGKFVTMELDPGTYTFNVKADGFRDGQCTATIVKPGDVAKPSAGPAVGASATPAPAGGTSTDIKDAAADCVLEALPRVGNLVGRVRDAESMAPLPGVTVKITDSSGKVLQVQTDPQGSYRVEGLPPGQAQVQIEADDFLFFQDSAEVKVRQDNTFDANVRKKPKQGLVAVGKSEITIKQQIQFALDQAVILPESTPLLTEIADVLVRTPRIKRVEIQGHTDNSGTPEHNQALSEQRAEAVRKWLSDHGVTPDRMVAKGYGQSKPLVPNVTAANKAKNRRVQFVILDQEPEAPKGGGGKPKTPPPF